MSPITNTGLLIVFLWVRRGVVIHPRRRWLEGSRNAKALKNLKGGTSVLPCEPSCFYVRLADSSVFVSRDAAAYSVNVIVCFHN